MMSVVQAIILGAIQGFSEFLPISSSGHLVIAQSLLGVTIPGITFEVMVHVGTLIAVIAFYWQDIWRVAGAFLHEAFGSGRKKGIWRNYEARVAVLIVAASVPAAVVGLLLKDYVESAFSNPLLVGAALLITGLALWTSEGQKKGRRKEPDLKMGDALAIGFAQAIAIVPGLSRSGLTISTGLRRKMERPLAARFSFLLSIPAVGGAALLDLYDVWKSGVQLPWVPILAGTLASFITGIVAIRLIVGVIKAGRFRYFAVYCWALGSVTLVVSLLRARGA